MSTLENHQRNPLNALANETIERGSIRRSSSERRKRVDEALSAASKSTGFFRAKSDRPGKAEP